MWNSELTDHQERRRQIDSDKVDAEIHRETKGSCGSHHGADISQKTKPWLWPDCVAHHARNDAVKETKVNRDEGDNLS